MPAGGIASPSGWWQSKHPVTGKPGPGKPPFTTMPIPNRKVLNPGKPKIQNPGMGRPDSGIGRPKTGSGNSQY